MADNKRKSNRNERAKVNSSEPYELKYLADKLGVSVQAINGAKRATGSNDRKVIEKYILGKQNAIIKKNPPILS
jgi:hypothetical protein